MSGAPTGPREDGLAALLARRGNAGSPEVGEAYAALIDQTRALLDALAGAAPDLTEMPRLREEMAQVTALLEKHQVDDIERHWGHWPDLPGRGQALVPTYTATYDDLELRGSVTFGRFHVGENMVVHGGAIGLLFDDALGALMAHSDLPVSRTVHLAVDFRSITPVGVELTLRGRVDRVEGRKRYLVGELLWGETVCAEANGIWVELRPGQA